MSEFDTSIRIDWRAMESLYCPHLDGTPFEGGPPIPYEDFDEITVFLRDHELCWGECGNETLFHKRLLYPFEESLFWLVPKSLWTTEVPWKDKIWDGGVLLAIPQGEGNLRDLALEQFKLFKDIRNRPLFKKKMKEFKILTKLNPIPWEAVHDFPLMEAIYEGETVPDVDPRAYPIIKELIRQVRLIESVTIEDVVFVSSFYKRCAGIEKVPNAPSMCTFYRIR